MDHASQTDHEVLNFKEISTKIVEGTSTKYSPEPRNILGKGSTAIVHPGYHFGKDVPTAVKFIKKEHLRQGIDPMDELKIWRQNCHNNYIICLHDSHINPEIGLFLVMELAVRTFREQIEKCDTSREEVIKWMYQVSTGLEYIHGKGGIHGDIKPDNILMVLQDDGKLIAKLADIGVNKIISGVEGAKIMDIFDLGKVIYFGLSKDPNAVPKQSSSDQAPANDLLMRMMAGKPENRPNISQVLSHCLFWDWEKEHTFLIRAAICSSNENCKNINTQADSKYMQYFCKLNPGKRFNWIESGKANGLNISELYFTSISRTKATKEYGDGQSVTKFVKFFRDKYVHYPDMKPAGINVFSDNDGVFREEKYLKILTSVCPGLSLFLHTGLSLNPSVKSLLPLSKIYFPFKLRNGVQQTNISVIADSGTSVRIPSDLAKGNIGNTSAANLEPRVIRPITFTGGIQGRRISAILESGYKDQFEIMHGIDMGCAVSHHVEEICPTFNSRYGSYFKQSKYWP